MIVHLVDHPSVYASRLYRYLAQHLELEVIYRTTDSAYWDLGFGQVVHWDEDLLAGYRWRQLPTTDMLRAYLHAVRPAVVWAHGWNGYNAVGLGIAKRLGAARWLRGESSLLTPSRWWHRLIRRIVLPRLLRSMDACLAIGSQNELFYRHYGVPNSELFWVPYAVENDWWAERATAYDPHGPVTYVGKLLPEKGVEDLAAAAPDRCVFVGDGPLRATIEAMGHTVTGFQNISELPKWYAQASCIVVPSRSEPWGMVVNEALAMGRPVIATDRVNAAQDLVVLGRSGWRVPAHDPIALAQAISDVRRHAWSPETIRAAVQGFSYDADLCGLQTALKATVR